MLRFNSTIFEVPMKNKWILWTGLATFFVLFAFAAALYKERTILLDPAFHLFSIARTGQFAIQVFRFGAFFTQLFPLVCVKLGLPLPIVLQSYSLSFVVLDALLFVLLWFGVRQPLWALALLLNSILMVNETFYWIQPELKQGLSILIFYLGLLQSGRLRPGNTWFLPVHAGLLLVLAFMHPLLVFPFVSGFGLLLAQTPKAERTALSGYGITFLMFYGIKSQLFRNWYDDAQLENLKNFVTWFPNYFAVPTHKMFLNYFVTDYYALIPAVAGLLYVWAVRKKYRAMVWYAALFVGYILVVNVTFPDPQNLRRLYVEQFYLSLGAMTLIALVVSGAFEKAGRWLPLALIALIGVRVGHIYLQHRPYTEKLAWQRRFLQEHSGDKLIFNEKDVPESKQMQYTWGSAEEFWLLSTLESGETRSIVITDDPEILRKFLDRKNLFITKHKVYDYDELPKPYFNLKNDTITYHYVVPGR